MNAPLLRLMTLMLLLILTLGTPAQAVFCRNSDRSLCILSIKRSAKNYWEYRASVSIDNMARPIEVYNCRQHFRVRQDGKLIPFQPDGAGELICNFFKK